MDNTGLKKIEPPVVKDNETVGELNLMIDVFKEKFQ